MRIKHLDDRHRCLLEHLETFRRMMITYDEVRDYVTDVLQELAQNLNHAQSSVKFDQKTVPRGGYLEGSEPPNWKGTKQPLVTIGLEGFERGLGAIVGSSAVDQCWAYAYSYYYDSVNDDGEIGEFRRKLTPPEGFLTAAKRGYLFTKVLDELPIERFCDRQELTKYFREPLNLLLNWLANEKESVRRAAELSKN